MTEHEMETLAETMVAELEQEGPRMLHATELPGRESEGDMAPGCDPVCAHRPTCAPDCPCQLVK